MLAIPVAVALVLLSVSATACLLRRYRIGRYFAKYRAREQAHRESLERFDLAMRATFNVIWDYDIRANVMWRNDNFYRLFGYGPGELVPGFDSWASRAHPEDRDRVRARLSATLASDADWWSDCYRYRRADGSYAAIEDRCHILRAADGQPLRMVGAMQDVTERDRAERLLRLQGAALNAAASGIVISDLSGAIVWCNPAFTRLSGYSADEAVGRNPRELLKSGAHGEAFYRDLWGTVLRGDVWHGEMKNRRKDGTIYPERQTITPVKAADGTITHFVAIKEDLTGEKRLEAQFLQSQKMEVVGRLAGGIAHDFNNLLTVINVTADLLGDDLAEADPRRAEISHILEAGKRAASLTRQLLAFSRKQILNPDVLGLGVLANGMAEMLRRLIGEHIELVVKSPADLGRVRADAGQIEQVIMNLAVNARDAMPAGGRLVIETSDAELDESYTRMHPGMLPGSYVMLAVTDTGTGMDAATKARLFEPFFSTKPAGQGTGLGLSTVYGIVKQSGGSIWVYSELGQGTTFKVFLPRVSAETSLDTARPVQPQTGTGTETILIVEDEAAVQKLATRMLETVGYRVLAASNAGEALLRLSEHDGPVHLMLTDVVMPGISGRQLAAQVAMTRPHMPVLFTSGYTDDTILRHGVVDDVAHFIPKPFTRAELTHKVRVLLDDAPRSHRSPGAGNPALDAFAS